MDSICAFVDFQGFQLKGDKFIPREMAIASDFISQCIEINPEVDIHDLPKDEQNIVKYTTRNKTGLHLRPFNDVDYCFVPKTNQICDVLKIWYQMVGSEERPLVAFKNRQIEKYLKESGIPYVDLDRKDLNFPSYREIQLKYSQNYLCGYHKQFAYASPLKFKCAYRKCAQIYKEIKDRSKSGLLDQYDDKPIANWYEESQ